MLFASSAVQLLNSNFFLLLCVSGSYNIFLENDFAIRGILFVTFIYLPEPISQEWQKEFL